MRNDNSSVMLSTCNMAHYMLHSLTIFSYIFRANLYGKLKKKSYTQNYVYCPTIRLTWDCPYLNQLLELSLIFFVCKYVLNSYVLKWFTLGPYILYICMAKLRDFTRK